MSPPVSSPADRKPQLKHYLHLFTFTRRAATLVWSTSRRLFVLFILLTIMGGLLPGAMAYVSKLLVDSVVQAAHTHAAADQDQVWTYVGIEAGLVILTAAISRILAVSQSLLHAQLGHRVNFMILEKALTLDLSHFEDSDFYDKMSQARRQASSRPLSLVNRTLDLLQGLLTLATYAGLLLSFSPWAVLVLVVAGLPTFLVETVYSGQAFRLFTWRSPEARMQIYLETVIAREDFAKEIMLFGLGPLFLQRYDEIYRKLYAEDRSLTLRRGFWAFVVGLLGTGVLYGAYVWVVKSAVAGMMTIGAMTMLLMVFKQGQSAVSSSLGAVGRMYEDNLYLSNLYEFLERAVQPHQGTATAGTVPGDGVRFENVSFAYPGQTDGMALENVSFHLKPGEKLALVGENGSGKTTLVKLLARLYTPTQGRVLLDGRDLQEWSDAAIRARIGVIFQDFVRYQLSAGENIGVGDVRNIEDETAWKTAAGKGLAAEFLEGLPDTYKAQLGRWFKGGRELSGGQWQKVALSRAFMRTQADILILDEPTSAVDPKAEVQLFEHFQEISREQMAILISHRFSTVRKADRIMVLDQGKILEYGTHEELLEANGHYAQLFRLQAEGYR